MRHFLTHFFLQEDNSASGVFEEVFLGTQSPVVSSESSVSSDNSPYQVIDISKPLYSSSKVHSSLWSVYQKNKDTTKTTNEVTDADEASTEGFNIASIMSYATPDKTEETTNDDKDDITHEQSEHKDTSEDTKESTRVFSFAQPPSLPNLGHGEIKIHSFGKEVTTTAPKQNKRLENPFFHTHQNLCYFFF